VCLEASIKQHVHKKIEIFWTNIASTMAWPNSKNGTKNGLRSLRVNEHSIKCVQNEVSECCLISCI
jgi:methyl coenzyme M reductase beta subunit